jgi:hypothetical protein
MTGIVYSKDEKIQEKRDLFTMKRDIDPKDK